MFSEALSGLQALFSSRGTLKKILDVVTTVAGTLTGMAERLAKIEERLDRLESFHKDEI